MNRHNAAPETTVDPNALAFLNLLKRGTVIEITADGLTYVTSTEIIDAEPGGGGGVHLTLDATVDDGCLVLTPEMIAKAAPVDDGWEVRHGGLIFCFGRVEGEPLLFGSDGIPLGIDAQGWEEHRQAVHDREACRDARRHAQEG